MAEQMETFGGKGLEFDEIKLYFKLPLKISDNITIYTPTVGDIIEYGEKEYFSMIHLLTCIPSDMMSQLQDMGIDFEEISEFELFNLLSKSLTVEQTKIILGEEIDFSQMQLYQDQNGLLLMGNQEMGIMIDELSYKVMAACIRKIHGIKYQPKKAYNRITKRKMIEYERFEIERNKKKPWKSQLLPLVSSMMRFPGFKYKSDELYRCSFYEFMDTVEGAQIYIASTALLQGSYSGMIDTSKIDKKEFNWMRRGCDEEPPKPKPVESK